MLSQQDFFFSGIRNNFNNPKGKLFLSQFGSVPQSFWWCHRMLSFAMPCQNPQSSKFIKSLFSNQWIIVFNNRDYNINQNNRDYEFYHNRAALITTIWMFLYPVVVPEVWIPHMSSVHLVEEAGTTLKPSRVRKHTWWVSEDSLSTWYSQCTYSVHYMQL